MWIPVETVVFDTEVNGTTNKAMAIQDGENYKGLLYDFTSSDSTVKSGCTTTTDSYREPDIVSNYDNNTTYLGIMNAILGINLANSEDLKTHLQEEYKNMIKSVKKYNGFYVGRYETSLNGNTVQSKKNQTSATAVENSANIWYGLYAKQKTYNTQSVQGQMIWGSQWDAMLNWMLKNNIDVSSDTPINGVLRNKTRITGSAETDKLNNIYDLLGNSYEWTTENQTTYYRVFRRRYIL